MKLECRLMPCHSYSRYHYLLAIISLLAFISCFMSTLSYANASQTISSKNLLEMADEFDGKTVKLEGEAIGDVMVRGKNAWANINDDGTAIGIWTRSREGKKIMFLGSYKFIGDKVLVSGIFNKACKTHGGDTDIHALSFNIVSKGREIKHPVNKNRLFAAFSLLIISGATLTYSIKRTQNY